MIIPTEPIGSIPRPLDLLDAILAAVDGADPALDPAYESAIRDTIAELEATGSPIISDGEQRKYHNFWTYCVHGLPNMAPGGFKIPFAAGHTRHMPKLGFSPFCDDTTTSRETAFAKIAARVRGTALAAEILSQDA